MSNQHRTRFEIVHVGTVKGHYNQSIFKLIDNHQNGKLLERITTITGTDMGWEDMVMQEREVLTIQSLCSKMNDEFNTYNQTLKEYLYG